MSPRQERRRRRGVNSENAVAYSNDEGGWVAELVDPQSVRRRRKIMF